MVFTLEGYFELLYSVLLLVFSLLHSSPFASCDQESKERKKARKQERKKKKKKKQVLELEFWEIDCELLARAWVDVRGKFVYFKVGFWFRPWIYYWL